MAQCLVHGRCTNAFLRQRKRGTMREERAVNCDLEGPATATLLV